MRQVDQQLTDRLTAALIDLQGERSDAAFAALLGCTRPHWWNIKHGKRRPSYALVKRAAQRFPGALRSIVLLDLAPESAPDQAVAS